MAKSAVDQVIQRAIGDAAFRRQLQREPAKALAGFDLTQDERASITSGDPARLTALGVDQRMSKMFALGTAAEASAVRSTMTGEPGTAGTAAFVDEAASGSTRGLVGDDTSGSPSLFGDNTAGATSVIPGDTTAGATASFSDASDGNVIDAGYVDPADISRVTAASEPSDGNTIDAGYVDPATATQVTGTQVTIDDGQQQTAFESDGAMHGTSPSLEGTTSDGSTGVLTGLEPGPTFDGHVDVNDQPSDY